MSSDLPPALKRELLDDFYAECADQLAVVRRLLADFNATSLEPAKIAETLEALMRNLHSIKGNAAIVGLRAVEELAHAAEDHLRALIRRSAAPSATGLELLEASALRLEEIVLAHRREGELPAIADLVARFEVCGQVERPGGATAASPGTARTGVHTSLVTFVPSRERDARGVNVNSVRARLNGLGRIVKAIPQVRPGGVVAFDFTLETAAPVKPDETWEGDGLSVAVAPERAAPARPTAPTSDAAASLFVAPSQLVRVDLSRLDDLLRIAGELVIHRSRLEDRLDQADGDQSALRDVARGLARSLRDLRHGIMRVRLVAIAEVFDRMPFVVRDLARESGCTVKLVVRGEHTEVDKHVVERVKEPLLHLVRNAMTHGFEAAAARQAAGKPADGTLELSAATESGTVVLVVRDDGQGIDFDRVRERARHLGLSAPDVLDAGAVLRLICTPGFSTRDHADLGAGRGVGMAVVQRTLHELGGTLSLQSIPGRGTAFTLRVPLTLSIVDALIVSVESHLCAVPQTYVAEIVEAAEADVQSIKDTEIIPYRGGVLPLVRLRGTFRVPGAGRAQLVILVITTDRGSTGLVVDRVHTRREVVVRPMNDPLVNVPGISGATELGDGRPVLILDAVALTAGVVRPVEAGTVKLEATPS